MASVWKHERTQTRARTVPSPDNESSGDERMRREIQVELEAKSKEERKRKTKARASGKKPLLSLKRRSQAKTLPQRDNAAQAARVPHGKSPLYALLGIDPETLSGESGGSGDSSQKESDSSNGEEDSWARYGAKAASAHFKAGNAYSGSASRLASTSESDSNEDLLFAPMAKKMKTKQPRSSPIASTSAVKLEAEGEDSSSDSEIDLLAAPSKRPSSSAPQYQTAPLSTPTSISLAPKALKSKLPSSSDTDAEPDLLAPLTPVPSWVSRAEVEPTRPDPGHVTPAAVPAPTSTPTSAPARPLDPEQDAELTARPAFAPSEAQKGIGPLVLDERAGVQVPATINRFLRDYQREGIQFFYERFKEDRGGLLGDDMGLGKTIQVIGFLAAIMDKKGYGIDENRRIEAVRMGNQAVGKQKADALYATCLIICPSSVIGNWQRELDTWGYFEHAAYLGTQRKQVRSDFRNGRLDLVITSHETAALQIRELEDLDWTCIFIDEVHKVKNPRAGLTQAVDRFDCMRRFGLTGTAIQNKYEELHTIIDWTNPGKVGDAKDWAKLISNPLKRGQRSGASAGELAAARILADRLVHKLLPVFFKRRTKDLIRDQLPVKEDNIVFCPLTPLQIEVYKRLLGTDEVQFLARHADPCPCGKTDDDGLRYKRQNCCYRYDSNGDPWSKNAFKFIHLFQACSNHLALVFPDAKDYDPHDRIKMERFERQTKYVQLMFPDDWVDKKCNALNGMRREYCGKWLVLEQLLAQWKQDGDKVLIFSMNLRLLDFIENFLGLAGQTFRRLDGRVPQERRMKLVDDFNLLPEVFIFLISTMAGGTGLNLTGANKVVIFDPNWNPSHDLQAMDRAYRFGQTRNVKVYRLIGAGSLEECVYGRQIYKQQMMSIGYDANKEQRYFQGVQGDKDNPGELFGLKNILRLNETGLATKYIIDECNVTEVGFALEKYVSSKSDDGSQDKRDDDALVELMSGTAETSVTAELKQKGTTVEELLSRTGIDYTHLNTELTGGSRTEAEISKDAIKFAKALGRHGRKRSRTSGESSKLSEHTPDSRRLRAPAVWPPPRRAGVNLGSTSNSNVQDAQDDLEKMRPQRGVLPTLDEIAAQFNKSTADFAREVSKMTKKEREKLFERAIKQANHGYGSKRAGTGWTF